MPITEINGDLLNLTETDCIAHQCNCLTQRVAHLAKDVFARYPWADIYSRRGKVDYKSLPDGQKPGQIVVREDPDGKNKVINMLGQVFPGCPKFTNSSLDGFRAREEYFKKCLEEIEKIEGLVSVAFPYKIGCGAAGGDWDNYLILLQEFAKRNPSIEVFMVKKND